MTKRSEPKEFHELSEIDRPSKCAKVEAVLTCLSSVMVGDNADYYIGYLCDESKEMKLVSFEEDTQIEMAEYKGKPVELTSCEIRQSKLDELEIFVTKETKSGPSKKTFDTAKIQSFRERNFVFLKEVHNLPEDTLVSCEATVTEIWEPEAVGRRGKTKQVIWIEDETGKIKLKIWEEKVNTLEVTKRYRFTGLVIKIFEDKCLETKPQESFIEEIEPTETDAAESKVAKQ